MRSTNDAPPHQQYLLNAVAPSGRLIEPCVFTVAQQLAGQAVSYAEKFLGDSCIAMNLLEEAAATVSEVIQTKEAAQIAPICDVGRYLFRVFLRKLAEARRNEIQYEEASQWHSHLCNDGYFDGLDSQVLLDQILDHLDSVTREMILRRIEGHSWDEIAAEFDLSNHAARVRFSKALQWLRTSVKTSRNGSFESRLPRRNKYYQPRDRKAQRVAAFERRLDRMFTPAFYREFHQFLRAMRATGSL
ncbi:MAG TPA: sigma factor-like helix-turn-helix DNA-binding protein [Candidatus Dormibacteraeota bacterium]|nr:sigma factor-like helix-turn-helix DNA-binding protein [Candidatus Dormibacteraeota bacterium]